ncbi:MAG TPA: hypothetical protein PL009_09155 [Flavipsychrobacter sp.]|nr:hypothetical protein [Flavipsychrobacter sp.]
MKYGIFFFLVIIVCSCNKEKTTRVPVNAELKKNFNYDVGSYWVYRDSLTGDIDSLFVVNNEQSGSDFRGTYTDYCRITLRLKQQRKDSSDRLYFWLRQNEMSIQWDNPLIRYTTTYVIYYYPVEVPKIAGGIKYIRLLPSMIVSGKVFEDVLQLNADIDSVEKGFNALYDRIYINTGYGILKMRLDHPQVNLLKDYEVQRWNIKIRD